MSFVFDYVVPFLKFCLPAILFLFFYKFYLADKFDKEEEFK
jgi:hypothetical protein